MQRFRCLSRSGGTVKLHCQTEKIIGRPGKHFGGFFPGWKREIEIENKQGAIEKDVSLQAFTSSELVPLETYISQNSASSNQKEQKNVLSQLILSFFKPLSVSFKTRLEVFLVSRSV